MQACWRGRVATNREVDPRGILAGGLREREDQGCNRFQDGVGRNCRKGARWVGLSVVESSRGSIVKMNLGSGSGLG